MNADIPDTPYDRVLSHLRAMHEKDLHVRIVIPLLKAMGCTHVQHVHGPFERGKDIVFIVPDPLDDARLEVCQVKNAAITGSATDPNATSTVLTQLQQAREYEVLNPLTNQKELPHSVRLLSTYPIHDYATADAGTFLRKLRAQQCRIIGPEQLCRLMKDHLGDLFDSLAYPGEGLTRALQAFVGRHQEAEAFGLTRQRLLSDFVVNLDLQAVSDYLTNLLTPNTRLNHRLKQEISLEQLEVPLETSLAIEELINTSCTIEWKKHESVRSLALVLGVDLRKLRTHVRKCLRPRSVRVSRKSSRRSRKSSHGATLTLLKSASLLMERMSSILTQCGLVTSQSISDSQSQFEAGLDSVPPTSFLESRFDLCITGDAGAGKTTLARTIADCAFQQNLTCIYFPCAWMQHGGDSWRDDYSRFMRHMHISDTPSTFDKLTSDASVIVFDGCDEAPCGYSEVSKAIHNAQLPTPISINVQKGISSRLEVPLGLSDAVRVDRRRRKLLLTRPLNWIDQERLKKANIDTAYYVYILEALEMLQRCPQMIVTTRDASPLQLHEDQYIRLRLCPMTDEQLTLFFTKWYGDDDTTREEILTFLTSNDHIREVCRMPMVATLVCALKDNGFDLPHSMTEVYEQRFGLLLDRWDRIKKVPKRGMVDSRDKLYVLMHLAFDMHRHHRRSFNRQHLETIWDGRLDGRYPTVDSSDLLHELRYINCVVEQTGSDSYSLGHLSNQEYLTAKAIVFYEKMMFLASSFHDKWWRQVLIFYAGIRGDVSALLERVQERHGFDRDVGLFNAMLDEARFTPSVLRDLATDIAFESYDDNDLSDDYLVDDDPFG